MVRTNYTAVDYSWNGVFGKMGNKLSAEDRETLVMLVMFIRVLKEHGATIHLACILQFIYKLFLHLKETILHLQ